jgi:hypothetical protein
MRDTSTNAEDAEPIRVPGVLCEDLENGKYLCTYVAKYEGHYTINVDFLGTFGGKPGALRGSGGEIEFSKTAPREYNQVCFTIIDTIIDTLIHNYTEYTH